MSEPPDNAWTPRGVETLPDDDDLGVVIRRGEPIAVSRQKALLRHLAVLEAARLGLHVSEEQVQAATGGFRERFGLGVDSAFDQWLKDAGFERQDFEAFIREVALVDLLEARLDPSLRGRIAAQRRAETAYRWSQHEQWAQINVALTRGAAGAVPSAVALFERIWPLVAPSLRPARLRRFFVTRKPPDLRLRIAGADPEGLLAPFLEALRELEAGGAVAQWYLVPYEPETARFGGERVMRLTHDWFETDSLAWFRWEPLHFRHGNSLSREVLSIGVLNDLFLSVVQDGAEIWDVWRRVAARHDVPGDAPAAAIPPVTIDSVAPLASRLEAEILAEYRAANQAAAAALEDAARHNELRVPPRQLMEVFTLFHWNRLRVSMDMRQRIAAGMVRAWDPHLLPRTGPAGGGGVTS